LIIERKMSYLHFSKDLLEIINKYLPTNLYGGFIIIRYTNEIYQNDIPQLVIFDTNKEKVLKEVKNFSVDKYHFDKYARGKWCVVIGICIKRIEIGKNIPRIEWNDCQGYFSNSEKLDRQIHLDRIN
jgi:hypothetical protein